MDVPKSFRPEGNLDDKTDRLLKEEPKSLEKQRKNLLDNVIEELNQFAPYVTDRIHLNVENLLEKCQYKPLKFKTIPIFGLEYKYWIRPGYMKKNVSYIFIKSWDKKKIIRYSFAEIDNDKIKKFYRSFEKYEHKENWKESEYINNYFWKGALAGVLACEILVYVLQPQPLAFCAFYGGILSSLGSGILLGPIMQLRDDLSGKKKIDNAKKYFGGYIVRDNVIAVDYAFGPFVDR